MADDGRPTDRPERSERPSRAPASKRAQRKAQRQKVRERKRLERRTLWNDAKNLPNLLTFGRIVMIPVVLLLLSRGTPRDCFWAAIVYGLAALTDALDGWLARRQGLVSVLGKFLDPLADKLIVAATAVWLVSMGRIAAWAVALLISREITITALRSIASSEGLVIAAEKGGKAKTALQMIGIVCLILGFPYHVNGYFYDFGVIDLVNVGRLMVYASLVFSLTSAVGYMSLFAQAIEQRDKPAPKR
ncbi:MAG: CDP-diacylglycerol--glycerol-3-phosphate 3-phosphatidyltransferase [Polyangiaceae bacterium]|nr:CDP-diacylglycerol--glycerol-3-phosphate 3-phosphatidyltransferase [Polyangiaceae bacterium]